MDQIEKALDGVRVIEPGILSIRHPEHDSPELVDRMFTKGNALCAEWDEFYFIVEMPNRLFMPADIRQCIQAHLKSLEGRLLHIAFVSDTSAVLAFAFRFVAVVRPEWKYSLHKTREDAIARVKELRAKVAAKGHQL